MEKAVVGDYKKPYRLSGAAARTGDLKKVIVEIIAKQEDWKIHKKQ